MEVDKEEEMGSRREERIKGWGGQGAGGACNLAPASLGRRPEAKAAARDAGVYLGIVFCAALKASLLVGHLA